MPRLQTLQVTRGIAANLVVLCHLHSVSITFTGMSALPAFTSYGAAGVDLFFVLSGFIMVAVAGRNIGPLAFIWRRVARIYPAYWMASLLTLCLVVTHAIIHSTQLDFHGSVLWRSFLIFPQSSLPLLIVGWTLVFEMYFYLVFAIFLTLRIPILIGLIAWGIIICVVLVVAPDQVADFPVLHVIANPITAEFIMGAAIGILWLNRSMPASRIAGVVGLLIVVAITRDSTSAGYLAPAVPFSANPHQELWRVFLFGVPAALILYALAALELRTTIPRVLGIAVKLGDWSYGTYLMHVLVISTIAKTLSLLVPNGGIGITLLLVVAGLIAANLAGALAHIFFELPTLRWLHKLGSNSRRPVGGFSVEFVEPTQSL